MAVVKSEHTLLTLFSSLINCLLGVFALTKTSLELTPLYGQLMDINNRLTIFQQASAPMPLSTSVAGGNSVAQRTAALTPPLSALSTSTSSSSLSAATTLSPRGSVEREVVAGAGASVVASQANMSANAAAQAAAIAAEERRLEILFRSSDSSIL